MNVVLPPGIKDEIGAAAFLIPLMEDDLRMPVSLFVSAIDAAPTAGGAVECRISDSLASAFWLGSEQKGSYMRLDDEIERARRRWKDALGPKAALRVS